jgi:hypothetical protein
MTQSVYFKRLVSPVTQQKLPTLALFGPALPLFTFIGPWEGGGNEVDLPPPQPAGLSGHPESV